jgi:hypothetical protein
MLQRTLGPGGITTRGFAGGGSVFSKGFSVELIPAAIARTDRLQKIINHNNLTMLSNWKFFVIFP